MDKNHLDRETIVDYLGDIFMRRGTESYLGEAVTMSQHMLQTAYNAEKAGQSKTVIVAALLHDIGHYTGEFPDDYIQQGVDNRHEHTGAAILEKFFGPEIVEPVRLHVDAKRYLCAIEPEYFDGLSDASVQTLALQGGPFNREQAAEFEKKPHLETTIRIRKFDDNGKTPGLNTPGVDYYLAMVQAVLDEQPWR